MRRSVRDWEKIVAKHVSEEHSKVNSKHRTIQLKDMTQCFTGEDIQQVHEKTSKIISSQKSAD